MQMNTESSLVSSPIFAYGFRPFFLLAAIYAPLALLPWVGALLQLFTLPMPLPPIAWHGHEMLFGFVGAALAGFLLTAVPSWSGYEPVTGGRLLALVLIWLAGRVLFWLCAAVPPVLVAAVNLLFSLALLASVVPAFCSEGGRAHTSIGVGLAVYVVMQGIFYLSWLWPERLPGMTSIDVLNSTVNLLLVMIALTVSRIVRVVAMAARHESGLCGPFRLTVARERLAVFMLVLFAIADVFAPGHAVTGWIALAAAAAQADRISEWPWGRSMKRPYLLLLTLSYVWMMVGLVLVGITDLTALLPGYTGRHALSAGAVGTAVLAVLCIAGLRHTGRPLRLPRVIWIALAALVVTVILRTLVPMLWPEYYLLAGVALPFVFWLLAYLLYIVGYNHYLLSVRADGKPG
ncbi:NnrS family protein [Marinobacter oulmenensis]|uniref:Uncharacterized protein involved in response to NO n=1 Tax=Marinobacter oulmenensis TaxID=643747 RepID=A0A840UA70_9GAMM|nr:NnrS family protein [Marinobacter oulmenensis]MBB5320080.1 uncharacterized protein involved in response to NO [Marinobacter oulmenensis]